MMMLDYKGGRGSRVWEKVITEYVNAPNYVIHELLSL